MAKLKTLSVTEYAKEKNISRQAVLKRIKTGFLKATRLGNMWVIKTK